MFFIIIFVLLSSTGSLFSMEKEKSASSPSEAAMQFTISCDAFVQKLQHLIVNGNFPAFFEDAGQSPIRG